MVVRRRKIDRVKWFARLMGVCVALIFAAYLILGPWWICRVVQGQEQPTITATWQSDTLVIEASPGSLYLRGGFRDDQFIGREHVELKAHGADQNYTPLDRESLILKNTDGQVVATLAIPLKPDRYKVGLPIVVT